jgi:hypothetical protein
MTKQTESRSPPLPSWQASTCLEILNHIQEQIRYADSKAGFVAAFNVLLFGFVATHLDKMRTACSGGKSVGGGFLALILVLVGMYVASMVATFVMVVLCVVSRFGERGSQSRVFFGHIAAKYGKDHARYLREIRAMTESDWVTELGTQVVEVSRLALMKHKYVRWAACCTLLSVLLWIGSLVAMLLVCWFHGL